MKKILTLLALGAFVTTLTTSAFAKNLNGEVTKVEENSITIKLAKKDAAKISVGDSVKVKTTAKTKSAPAAGNDALTGC
ncbi:MAG: hypothetical protein J7K75_04630 [Desulfuromonas sp.]|nr:hypothetical protein [Desulfuromonas sp.]